MFPDSSRWLIFKKITFKGLWCHHHVWLLPWLTVSGWSCYFIDLYSKWTSSGTEQAGIYICREVYNQDNNAGRQITYGYFRCALWWKKWAQLRNKGQFCDRTDAKSWKRSVILVGFARPPSKWCFFLNERKLLWAAKSMWSTVLLLWCHVIWKMAEMKAKMRVWNNYRNVNNCIVVLNG